MTRFSAMASRLSQSESISVIDLVICTRSSKAGDHDGVKLEGTSGRVVRKAHAPALVRSLAPSLHVGYLHRGFTESRIR